MTSALDIGIAGPADLRILAPRLHGPKPLTGGLTAPVVSHLVARLIDRGHSVTLFTLSTNPHDHGTFHGPNLEVIVAPNRARLRWVDAFRLERQHLLKAMKSSGCEVIHAHWTYEFALAALRSDLPTLVTVHDWGPQVLRHHLHHYRLVRLGMQARVLRKAPALTANSPYIAAKVERYFRRSIPVIPNGIDFRENAPKRAGSPGFVVGALNNGFGHRKNVHVLLRAFKVVRAEQPSASLMLAGSGYGPNEDADLWAREHGLHDGVQFLGAIPAHVIPEFMGSLDLFVHPSLEESFGMVLLEALAEGTPVVAGLDSGAVPWVLGGGAAGSLVDIKSPLTLASEICRLARDPASREESATAGLRHVKEQFSLDRVVDQYEEQYRRLLGRR